MLGRATRTAATMLGISSLVNDSVPRRLLGAGAEFPVRAFEGAVFLFPLEDPEVARVAGGRELARVEGLLVLGELMRFFAFSLAFLLQFADCSVRRMRCYSY